MAQSTDDKLAIYKSQANAASKKKEKAFEDLKVAEEEARALERTLDKRERDYAQIKGTKFLKHDDFKQYAATLKGKENQYKQMRATIQEIKNELVVLTNTENILSAKAQEIVTQLKAIELQTGAVGYFVHLLVRHNIRKLKTISPSYPRSTKKSTSSKPNPCPSCPRSRWS
jgi:hypothetical protein